MIPPDGRAQHAVQPSDIARIIAELSQIEVNTRPRCGGERETLAVLAEYARKIYLETSQTEVNTRPSDYDAWTYQALRTLSGQLRGIRRALGRRDNQLKEAEVHPREVGGGVAVSWPLVIIGGALAVAIGIRLADWSRHWF